MVHDLSSCTLLNSAEKRPCVHGGCRSRSAPTWLLKIMEQGLDIRGKTRQLSISGPHTAQVLARLLGNTLKHSGWQSRSPRRKSRAVERVTLRCCQSCGGSFQVIGSRCPTALPAAEQQPVLWRTKHILVKQTPVSQPNSLSCQQKLTVVSVVLKKSCP